MKPQAECMLVLIGATPEGVKELIGFQSPATSDRVVLARRGWRAERGVKAAVDMSDYAAFC